MRLINKKNLIFLTSILLVIISIEVLKQTKPIELDEVKLLEASDNTSFAMYKEDGEVYTEVEGNTFPEGYFLNLEKSKCIDSNGNEIKGVLSYEDNQVKLTSNKTIYCYLYFDKSSGLKIIESNPKNLNANQAGMYRYQGSNDEVNNNYICFGTSDKDECITNKDKYMYRIIGIDEKSYELKLIKATELADQAQWHSDNTVDIPWGKSDLYKRLNGLHNSMNNIFIDNPNYSYLSNSLWIDKISKKTWLNGKTIWDEFNTTPENLYLIESGKNDVQYYVQEPFENKDLNNVECYEDSDSCYHYESSKFVEKVDALIGLMYLHDYYYSPVIDGVNCHYSHVIGGRENASICHSSWLYNEEEYIIDRFGYEPKPTMKAFTAWMITFNGANSNFVDVTAKIRPVFYLKNDIEITFDLGTIDNPYIVN